MAKIPRLAITDGWSVSVVASFAGIPGEFSPCDTSYDDAKRASEKAGLSIDETEPGESEYAYLATECGEPDDEDSWWYKWKRGVQDLTVSGVIPWEAFREWCDEIGAFPEDCLTMGTLGGPLSGGFPSLVWDIPFRCESQVIVESIRATPFLADDKETEVLFKRAFGSNADAMQASVRSAVFDAFDMTTTYGVESLED